MAQVQGTKVYDKDKDAVWVVNLSEFRFAHGARAGVVFDPKIATRVRMDSWIEGQAPLLQVMEDPHADELPASPVIKETPLIDSATKKPVTGVGTGPEGTHNGEAARREQQQKAPPAGKGEQAPEKK
jgi:hypothetical protein